MIFVIYSDFPFKAHGYILLAAKRLAEANPSRQTGMKLHTESHGGGRRGFCCSWKCPHFLSNSRWFSNGGSPPIGSHLLFKIWSLSSVQLHVVFLASQMNMFCCWHLLTGFLRLFSRILLYEMVMVDCQELMMELPWGLILLHACCTYERTFHYWSFVTCDMFISINKWLQNSKWINVCSFKRSSRELKLKLWIIWRCNISWYFRIDSIKKRNGYIMS